MALPTVKHRDGLKAGSGWKISEDWVVVIIEVGVEVGGKLIKIDKKKMAKNCMKLNKGN